MKDVNNNMAEMQLKVLEILHPEIQKLKNFMAFQAGFHYSIIDVITSALFLGGKIKDTIELLIELLHFSYFELLQK